MPASQYTSIRYTDHLATAGIAASVGTVGDSYDDAMAEAFNGTFKAEFVTLHTGPGAPVVNSRSRSSNGSTGTTTEERFG